MDVLSDLLHRARAKNAVVRQFIQQPPWSITLADRQPLSVVAALAGGVSVSPRNAGGVTLQTGDIALVKGGAYTIADDPTTPDQVVIRQGVKHIVGGPEAVATARARKISSRTYGDRCPGAIVMLHGIYDLHGSVGDRLLDMLPTVTVVPAGPRTRGPLELLSTEAERDEPGQDAVLSRLLDLVLVVALRWWSANGSRLPAWLTAATDPAIGEALTILHADPRRGWTTAALAGEVGMSRAAFSARFAGLVGEPPMSYLTGWRLTLAADLLRDTDDTIAAVAGQVGYQNAFAFSAAFKRRHGQSPTAWRRVR
ncbi:AraC family transcriptional regulator [Fodinicola acaciae]|uniref:AraC family transcriptional regulator n=1 Tax=Fodinicola acaciae TaxID=2681555 RepID=UPI0013D2B809|nr:AraC family transcriptional regulator [Fodinicola acaciae]